MTATSQGDNGTPSQSTKPAKATPTGIRKPNWLKGRTLSIRAKLLSSIAAVGVMVVVAVAGAVFLPSDKATAQIPEPDPTVVTRLVAEPDELSLRVGDVVPLRVTAYDAAGAVVNIPIRVSAPRRALRIRGGNIEAFQAGNGPGLLHLGATGLGLELTPTLAWWRELGRSVVAAACAAADPLDPSRVVPPPPDEVGLQHQLETVPPMVGGELVGPGLLEQLWGRWVRPCEWP